MYHSVVVVAEKLSLKQITNTFELYNVWNKTDNYVIRAVFVASTSDVKRTIGTIFSFQKWSSSNHSSEDCGLRIVYGRMVFVACVNREGDSRD